jgi:hypothetical protein
MTRQLFEATADAKAMQRLEAERLKDEHLESLRRPGTDRSSNEHGSDETRAVQLPTPTLPTM